MTSKIRNQKATTKAPISPATAPSIMIRVLECSIFLVTRPARAGRNNLVSTQLVTHKISARQASDIARNLRDHETEFRRVRLELAELFAAGHLYRHQPEQQQHHGGQGQVGGCKHPGWSLIKVQRIKPIPDEIAQVTGLAAFHSQHIFPDSKRTGRAY